MKTIKYISVYDVCGQKVLMERLKNSASGAPRWKATIVFERRAFVFNVSGYSGEEDEAKEALKKCMEFKVKNGI